MIIISIDISEKKGNTRHYLNYREYVHFLYHCYLYQNFSPILHFMIPTNCRDHAGKVNLENISFHFKPRLKIYLAVKNHFLSRLYSQV